MSLGTVSLQALPLSYKGARIDASVKLDHEDDVILAYEVWVENNQKGKKKIDGAKDFGPFGVPKSVTIRGCYLSPFEPRILVVYTVEGDGFEATPFVNIHLTGCQLLTRFTEN